MTSEWVIGGRRYGPDGQSLGPVAAPRLCQQIATGNRHDEPLHRRIGSEHGSYCPRSVRDVLDGENHLSEGADQRVLVVDGNLSMANDSGGPVRLWGCRMSFADESLTVLGIAAAYKANFVLLDLVLPRCNARRVAQRLRTKPHFKKAVLVAVRDEEWDTALPGRELAYAYHLIMTINPGELRELLASLSRRKPVKV